MYSLMIAFLFIDKVFVNIIYFQGMFYTQIWNTSIPFLKFGYYFIMYYCGLYISF